MPDTDSTRCCVLFDPSDRPFESPTTRSTAAEDSERKGDQTNSTLIIEWVDVIDVKRRRAIVLSGSVGLMALAGCSNPGGENDEEEGEEEESGEGGQEEEEEGDD